MLTTMKFGALTRFVSLLSCVLVTTLVSADTYPSRAIKIVVPFSAGGTPDLAARLIAEKLSGTWNVPVIVENQPGAGSTLGARVVSKSPSDGHTWLMASDGTMVINPAAGNAPYDVAKDFSPVTLVARVPFVLVVNSQLPVRTVAELVQYARERPGQVNFASAGIGTPQHLGMEMLKHGAGVNMVHVPYKGAAPAVIDLLANRVQVFLGSPNTLVQHIKDGKLRAIATAGSTRATSFAQLPTIGETFPNVKMDVWMGLFLPAGVPRPVIAKINADVASVLNAPDVKANLLEKQFLEVSTTTPEALGEMVRDGQVRWGRVIQEAGIKLQ
jgi:tripartite-type tricarboxylate transporter receptor subunit TctC